MSILLTTKRVTTWCRARGSFSQQRAHQPKSKLASTWMDVHVESMSMSMDASFEFMASRCRHGGVPTRDGEQRRDVPRREEQTEQQAPTPQGPVLPPPPPLDYGVFMQGLVQAMQTQAHTQAALQAQMEAQVTLLP
ncbi:hypothetical protein Taro_001814 [Colocasia esculenta]|uniref:Uncharacterized protein n=1 Tax=Colocasia esculenta TaxID=4460 RepID=A0A843TJ45_COLES|nr:hypothetical protein [Colocasia esculenta]